MKVQLVNAKETGECIQSQLRSSSCNDFRFAVAYARSSGVRIVAPSIKSLIARKGFVEGFVGVNQGNTSYQALCMLHDVMKGRLHVRYGKKLSPSFHPKIYIWGKTRSNSWNPSAILVGSSNLSKGGLDINEECGCFCRKEKGAADTDFFDSAREIWETTGKNYGNFLNLRVTKGLLDDLLKAGALVDERKSAGGRHPSIDKIIQTVNDVAAGAITPKHSHFVMTLSHFDTSAASSDPVILIPIRARDEDPSFWFWPFLYSRGNGLYEEYKTTARVCWNGRSMLDELRFYYYYVKSEFRLKSETIKRKGNKGDILLAYRKGANISLKLIRKTDRQYSKYERYLTKTVSPTKKYGYFTPPTNGY